MSYIAPIGNNISFNFGALYLAVDGDDLNFNIVSDPIFRIHSTLSLDCIGSLIEAGDFISITESGDLYAFEFIETDSTLRMTTNVGLIAHTFIEGGLN